jgi:hypothetical protein
MTVVLDEPKLQQKFPNVSGQGLKIESVGSLEKVGNFHGIARRHVSV